MERQIEVIEGMMKEFKWENKKIITIFNKFDVAPPDRQFKVKQFPRVFVSALTGHGFEQLKKTMSDAINEMQTEAQMYFSRAEEYKIYDLSREAKIIKKEPATEGVIVYALLTPTLITKWKDFLVK